MNVLWRRLYTSTKCYPFIWKITKTEPQLLCSYSSIVNQNVRENINLKPTSFSYSAFRRKSKKQQKEPDSDDESNDIEDDDSSLSKDSKLLKLHITSLRTDLILKSTLGIARNKVEQLFFESKIRVNGRKILKKSVPVRIDYEIDVIKSVSPKNPDHLYVARVIILNLAAKEETIAVTARRFKNLLIENYKEDPYKGSVADDDSK